MRMLEPDHVSRLAARCGFHRMVCIMWRARRSAWYRGRALAISLRPGSERIFVADDTDPVAGCVEWAPAKSLWIGSMTLAAILLGPLYFTWDALLLFIVTSGVTLSFGHSVGMHRCLIHRSFECPLWLEHVCVYLGTLVGMAGP